MVTTPGPFACMAQPKVMSVDGWVEVDEAMKQLPMERSCNVYILFFFAVQGFPFCRHKTVSPCRDSPC